MVNGAPAVFCLLASFIGAPAVGAALQGGPPSEKSSRSSAQQKLDSHLLQEIHRRQGKATEREKEKQVRPDEGMVRIDEHGRALVDVRTGATAEMERKIRRMAGSVVSTSAEYRSIVAWIPVTKLEALAGDAAVVAIVPAAEGITNPKRLK